MSGVLVTGSPELNFCGDLVAAIVHGKIQKLNHRGRGPITINGIRKKVPFIIPAHDVHGDFQSTQILWDGEAKSEGITQRHGRVIEIPKLTPYHRVISHPGSPCVFPVFRKKKSRMAFPAGFQFELAPYVAVRVRYFAPTLIVNRSSKAAIRSKRFDGTDPE